MAINFGDTIMEGSIEPSAKVQAPVMDNSAAIAASAGTALAEGLAPALNIAGRMAGNIFKQGQENANAKILVDYENELLDIADAVDQDEMSRGEAMILSRNVRRQYLANAPALQGDFDTVWSNTMGANGLGHVVIQGTQEEQNRIAMENDAAKLGYTPEEFGLFQSRTRQATELNYQLTQAENSGKLITETQRLQGLQSIVGVAESAYPSAQRQINEAMAKISANPNNKEQIATELNNVLGNSIAQLKFMGGSANSDYIVAPIEQAMTTFNQWVTGEVSNSVMEAELKSTQLKYDLMYASDPTLGPVIAASKMIGEIGMQNSNLFNQLFTPEVIQKFGQMANPSTTVNVIDGTDASARAIEAVKTTAGMINDDSDPELIAETRRNIEQLIDSAYVHERSADSPLNFKDLANSFGGPEISSFIATYGISPKYAQQVVEVFKSSYEQELLTVVNRAWTEPVPLVTPGNMSTGNPNQVVGGMQNIPMNQLLQPRWNGNAVEFVPTEAYTNNPRVIDLAREVTAGDNSIAIPLNNLIGTYSNLTGADGKTIYEQDFAGRLFGMDANGVPLEAEAPAVQSELDVTPPTTLMTFDTPEDLVNSPSPRELTLEDFQPEELEQIVVQTQAAEPEALMNATSPIGFAQAYIGMNEDNVRDQQVLSSFIKEAAGISINPAQTAWCAAFVDAILHKTGTGGGTGKLNARSYLDWGQPVSQPQEGDVVVMWRESPDSWKGHVGFYAGMTADGKIRVLGGNQGDSVSIEEYDPTTVLGYRRAG